jgi:hypothetical protein
MLFMLIISSINKSYGHIAAGAELRSRFNNYFIIVNSVDYVNGSSTHSVLQRLNGTHDYVMRARIPFVSCVSYVCKR